MPTNVNASSSLTEKDKISSESSTITAPSVKRSGSMETKPDQIAPKTQSFASQTEKSLRTTLSASIAKGELPNRGSVKTLLTLFEGIASGISTKNTEKVPQKEWQKDTVSDTWVKKGKTAEKEQTQETKKISGHHQGGEITEFSKDIILADEKTFAKDPTLYLNTDEARKDYKMEINKKEISLDGKTMDTKLGKGLTIGTEEGEFIFVMGQDKTGKNEFFAANMSAEFEKLNSKVTILEDIKIDGIKGLSKGFVSKEDYSEAISQPKVTEISGSSPKQFTVDSPNGSLFTKGQIISEAELNTVSEKINKLNNSLGDNVKLQKITILTDLKLPGLKGLSKGDFSINEVREAICKPEVTEISGSNPKQFTVESPNGTLFSKGQIISEKELNTINSRINRLQERLNANFEEHNSARFHHSSFLAGGDISGAGTLKVDNGKLASISDASGHYQPGIKLVNNVINEVEKKGVEIESVNIRLIKKGDKKEINVSALRVQENVKEGIVDVQSTMIAENKKMNDVQQEFMEKRFEKILKGNNLAYKIDEATKKLEEISKNTSGNIDEQAKLKFIVQIDKYLPEIGNNPETTEKLVNLKKEVNSMVSKIVSERISQNKPINFETISKFREDGDKLIKLLKTENNPERTELMGKLKEGISSKIINTISNRIDSENSDLHPIDIFGRNGIADSHIEAISKEIEDYGKFIEDIKKIPEAENNSKISEKLVILSEKIPLLSEKKTLMLIENKFEKILTGNDNLSDKIAETAKRFDDLSKNSSIDNQTKFRFILQVNNNLPDQGQNVEETGKLQNLKKEVNSILTKMISETAHKSDNLGDSNKSNFVKSTLPFLDNILDCSINPVFRDTVQALRDKVYNIPLF